MNYYNQRDSYNKYDDYQSSSKRNSNSFGEELNGAKRKKSWWSSKKRGGGGNRNSMDNSVFKEPISPVSRSPGSQYNRSSSRDSQHLTGGAASRGANAQPQFFDMLPDFVDPQHSGTKWHWDNYFQDCKSWQEKHKLAYYRSRCMALEFENQMLFEQINSLIQENCVFAVERGTVPSMRLPDTLGRQGRQPERAAPTSKTQTAPPSKTQTAQKKQGKKNKKTSTTTDSELEFEVCEDMMAFLEKSIRHKLDLRNKRNQDDAKSKSEDSAVHSDNDSKKQGPKQPTGQKRKEDLDLLYGSKAAVIQGLETAIQLNFNRSIDTYKPELWPAVPFNPVTMV